MRQYNVILSPKAQKGIKSVPDDYVVKIHKSLSLLSLNPRPIGSVKLVCSYNHYRIRVGVYRVIYSIKDDILTVEVIKIDHRRNVYR